MNNNQRYPLLFCHAIPSGLPLPVDGRVVLLKKPDPEKAWYDGRKSMELSCQLIEYLHAKTAVDIAQITLPARPNFPVIVANTGSCKIG
ncbi:hypothetical protein ACFX15_033314 [Malus domestica]